jgi:hypothetical protein
MSSAVLSANTLVAGITHSNEKVSLDSSFLEKPEPMMMAMTTTTTTEEEEEANNLDYVMTEEEVKGVEEMLKALSEDEKNSLADPHMPLRHFRAEKVTTRNYCYCIPY